MPDADRAKIRLATKCIMEGFGWYATPQGADYWEEVYRDLANMDFNFYDIFNNDRSESCEEANTSQRSSFTGDHIAEAIRTERAYSRELPSTRMVAVWLALKNGTCPSEEEVRRAVKQDVEW